MAKSASRKKSASERIDPTSPQLFLSHASEDSEAVRVLADQLRTAGVNVWLDLDELKPGDNWMERLETGLKESDGFAVYVGRVGIARWINREVRVALDRNAKDPEFRVIPILGPGAEPETLPSFLQQHQWLDLRDGKSEPADIKQLVGAILSRPAESVSLLAPGEAPFIGLAAFDVGHAHLFFGRDQETEELLQRLHVAPFLAMVGDSGSGKSSLLRAGLIPSLHSGRFFDGDSPAPTWRVAIMRPGSDPFRELTNALLDLTPEMELAEKLSTREACASRLSEGSHGLSKCIGALVQGGERTLIVVDQFEEVFTHVSDAEVRNRFIDTVLETADVSGDRPVHVVITLRADFYSRCFEHPNLPNFITTNQYAVRAIGHEQLVEVMEKPAAMAGVKLETGLVKAILSDLGEGPGNLPLLEHTLLQLWNLHTGEVLTHKSYDSIGRVQGALKHHAEEVFNRLDEVEQKQARKLFLSLVTLGKEARATRRRALVEQVLPPGETREQATKVLQELVEQRLLSVRTVDAGESDNVREVEVAHEALLRGWDRLSDWLDEDREFLNWRQRIRSALADWETSGRDQGALLRGGPLLEAQRWFDERMDDLAESTTAFIKESVAKAARFQMVKRVAVGTICVSLAVAIGLAVMATRSQKQAELSQQQAESNLQLATTAVDEMLTKVGSDALQDVPQLEDVRAELLDKAGKLYEQLNDQRSTNSKLPLQAALAPARLAEIDRQRGNYQVAKSGLELAIKELTSLVEGDPENTEYQFEQAEIHIQMGELLQNSENKREFAEAEEHYAFAIGRHQSLYKNDPKSIKYGLALAIAFLNRGVLRSDKLGDPKGAKEDLNQAVDLVKPYETHPGESLNDIQQHLARSNNSLANLLNGQGMYAEAAQRYKTAIDGFASLNATHNKSREYQEELAKTYNNLARALLYQSQAPDAEDANRKALDLFESLAEPLPELQVELANAHMVEGVILHRLDKIEATQSFQKTEDILETLIQRYPNKLDYPTLLKDAQNASATLGLSKQ